MDRSGKEYRKKYNTGRKNTGEIYKIGPGSGFQHSSLYLIRKKQKE